MECTKKRTLKMEDWNVAKNEATDILLDLKHLSNMQKENEIAIIIYDIYLDKPSF